MPRKFPYKLFQSELFRNTSILVGGNFIGQFIAYISLPLFTRFYSDSEFGIFHTFLSACMLLSIFGTGRYEESIVTAKDRKESLSLLGLTLRISMIVPSALFVLLLFFRKSAFQFFGWEEIEPFWIYIPFTVFFLSISKILNNLATRHKQFTKITVSKITHNLVNIGSKILFGILSLSRIGLVISNLLASFTSNFAYYPLKNEIKKSFKTNWKEVALKYKDFPTYNLTRTFISGVSTNLPFLFLLKFFDSGEIGIYSIAWTLLYMPLFFISDALFTTFFENASSSAREKKTFLPILKKYFKSVVLYILPFFIIAFFVAQPNIFQFIFGSEEWGNSAIYFRYLLPWMFLFLMASPIHFLPIIYRKQNHLLVIEIVYFIFRLIALLIGIYYMDFRLCILLFSITGFIFSGFQVIWFYRLAK